LIASNNVVGQARFELARLESELAASRKLLGDEASGAQQLKAKVEGTKAFVEKVAQNRADALRAEVQLAKTEEGDEATIVQQWEQRLSDWYKKKTNYDVSQGEGENLRALYQNAHGHERSGSLLTSEDQQHRCGGSSGYPREADFAACRPHAVPGGWFRLCPIAFRWVGERISTDWQTSQRIDANQGQLTVSMQGHGDALPRDARCGIGWRCRFRI
jgi:hypothetical protein